YPAVAEALLLSASPQVRNMASIGGNLLQRTRCVYFRDVVTPCNKRAPGSGCSALDGENRLHAILGARPHCIAPYAGDPAVALVAVGGVGSKPWRLPAVEHALVGHRVDDELFHAAAARAADGAEPRRHNAFKVELLKRTVERALRTVGSRS